MEKLINWIKKNFNNDYTRLGIINMVKEWEGNNV